MQYDHNLIIQTSIVAVVVLGALIVMVRSVIRLRKSKGASACSGCVLVGKCSKPPKKRNKDKHSKVIM
ncbi:MAG: hypothetical protein K2K26_00700, partial [Muribaculaceae bacterium]|nr:hypothetical protein [Muribaculaceae bacterium]